MKLTITSANLAGMIAQTLSSVSKDKYRAVITGVYFVSDGETLRLIATDTHRMSVATLPVTGDPFDFILPAADVRNVKRILLRKGDCTLEFTDGLVCFTADKGAVYAEPLVGTYPNYQRVIPTDSALEVLCDKSALLATFTTLMAHKPEVNRCVVNLADGCLLASAYNLWQGQRNETSAVCETAWTQNAHGLTDFSFAVNGAYMVDAVRSVPADTVRLRFQGERGHLKPILIDGCDPATNFHVLMPMSIPN